MSDRILLIIVPAVALGGLVGIAYLLDQRTKKNQPVGPKLPEPGPLGRSLLWITRALVVIMLLSIIGAFVFKSLALAGVTAGCLALYIINGLIFRAIRLSGW